MNNWIRNSGLIILILIAGCTDSGIPANCTELEVSHPWIREAPPGAGVMAAYVTLRNPTAGALEILSAQSPSFSKVEFHETLHQNGSMSMRALPTLKIAADTELSLEPGGVHMMLFEPASALREGDSANLSFKCAGNQTITFTVPVKRADAALGDHSHHHHD